jgi:DNA modification methylase
MSRLETVVWDNVQRKGAEHEKAVMAMMDHMGGFGRASLNGHTTGPTSFPSRKTDAGDWTLYQGDSVEVLPTLQENSVGLSVFSPPFSSLYTYSDDPRDLGNSASDDDFARKLLPIMAGVTRALMPGRLACIHVAQVATKLASDGVIGLKDFRGLVIRVCQDAGMIYHGDITVDKNPQAQAVRTHAKGLLFAQLRKDSSWLRPGLADYVLLFRKPGDNPEPIHPDIDNDTWIQWAHPVWYGIRENDTLNGALAREDRDERHIAPLQLSLIERCVKLWSNPDDIVLSPFAGIGSEGYVALKNNRRFVGIELKGSYYDVACNNLATARQQLAMSI